MPPVAGVAVPVEGIHVTHMGNRRPREIQSPPVMGQQGLHHIGVVHRLRFQAINRRHDRRHGIQAPELGHHRVDHRRIDERLITLDVDHRSLFGHCRALPPGQRHQLIRNRGNSLTAGAAIGRGHQHGKSPSLGHLLKLLAVSTQHHVLNAGRLAAPLQHPLDHRLTSDVREHFVRQPGRLQTSRNRHHCLLNRHQSQSFIASSLALNHSAANGPPMVLCSRNQGPPRVQCSIGGPSRGSGGV